MLDRPRLILALGLALAVGGCAALPRPSPGLAGDPGEGFTNSGLRTALYAWAPEDGAVKQTCLRNSLVLFTRLQECADLPASETSLAPAVRFGACVIRRDRRSATFLVPDQHQRPWAVEVTFDPAAQRFLLAGSPQG